MCENESTEIGKKVTEEFVKNASQAYVAPEVSSPNLCRTLY